MSTPRTVTGVPARPGPGAADAGAPPGADGTAGEEARAVAAGESDGAAERSAGAVGRSGGALGAGERDGVPGDGTEGGESRASGDPANARSAESRPAESRFAESRFTESRSAESRSAETRSAVIAGAGPVARSGARAGVRPGNGDPEEPPLYAPEWLRLREDADAAARSPEPLGPLRAWPVGLPGTAGRTVVHDLGCGTGSMGRWLAPRLDGAQHWILHDRDPRLLRHAAASSPRRAADGSPVTVDTRRGDIARLTAHTLAGATLVTASALLDVLTREEVEALADACAGAGCPALLTLTVAGRVEPDPADPLDAEIAEAFNAHQRRTGLLGPDATAAAREAFTERGATVRLYPSPWRLGPGRTALTEQWLRGWVGAAVEQRPELRDRAERYLRSRLAACAAGTLRVTVHHTDLLALPRPTGGPA